MAKKRTKPDGTRDLADMEKTEGELSLVLRAVAHEYRDYGVSGAELLSPQCAAGHARIVAMSVLKQDFRWEYAKIAPHFNASTPRVIEEFEAIDWLERTPYYGERLDKVRKALKLDGVMEDRSATASLCQFSAPIRRAVESAAAAYGVKVREALHGSSGEAENSRMLAAYAMRRYLMMRYTGIGNVLGCSKSAARELCREGGELCGDSVFAVKLAVVRNEIDRS